MNRQRKWLAVINTALLFAGVANLFIFKIPQLSLLFFCLLFILNRWEALEGKKYLDQLQMYEKTSKRVLQNGELQYITPLVLEDNILLGLEYNKLIRELKRQQLASQAYSQVIQSVSKIIDSPFVLLNENGLIDFANDSFKEWFSGRDVRKIPNNDLRLIIQDTILRQKPRKQEIKLDAHYYIASSNPVLAREGEVTGTVILFHDITELKSYQALQRDFFGNASHELKTPISAIKGCADILLSSEHDAAIRKEFLTIIQDENQRLEQLVQDLLLLNRYDFHQIQLKKEPFHLNRLVSDSILSVLNVATLKKVKIHLSAPEPIHYTGDPTKIQQCILNLLSNAIHYAGDDKQICVNLSRKEEGRISLIVEDNGAGIAAEHLPHLFERFYRVDRARSRYTGGTGLGLSIVQSIVEAHEGEIRVESTLGKGTRFEILI